MPWRRMEDIEEEEFIERWEDKNVIFSNNEVGTIEDVIEDEYGNPVMLQVNTPRARGRPFGGKSVLVPMELIIDEDENNVYLDLNTEEANNLPEVDEETPITDSLVDRVYRNLESMGIYTPKMERERRHVLREPTMRRIQRPTRMRRY
ncbi:MAG: PRC-barrel domain-containing protein [Thermoplasmata archaeon]